MGGRRRILTLVEHYNGSKWSTVKSPDTAPVAIAALSDEDIWAVGSGLTGGSTTTRARALQRKRWSIVESPNAINGRGALNGITAVSAGNVWAVGDDTGGVGAGDDCGPTKTLIEHYDGAKWTVVKSPNSSR